MITNFGSSYIFVEQQGNVAATLLFEIQKALSEYFRSTTANARGAPRGAEEGCFNCGINSAPVFRSSPDDRAGFPAKP